MKDHIVNHIKHKGVRDGDNRLHVVCAITNPARFHSRYRLAKKFIEHMASFPEVQLTVVEGAYGSRHYELEEECLKFGADHVKVQLKQEIWVKESLINIGFRHVFIKYPKAKYLCWNDMDIHFHNSNWAQEAIHQLQHFHVIQPWQSAVNLGPTGNGSKLHDSVGEKCRQGMPPYHPVHRPGEGKKRYSGDPYIFGHCGYGWCATRRFFENVQGLIDFAILGSADHHMALGCRGYYSHSVHSMMGGNFKHLIHAWQKKAMQLTHGHIGWVDGLITHSFHGPMMRRNYVGRWEILVKNNYDPVEDLQHDEQGLVILVGKPQLEHDIKMYNRKRLEDSIEEY